MTRPHDWTPSPAFARMAALRDPVEYRQARARRRAMLRQSAWLAVAVAALAALAWGTR